jgi:hypothetical protein
MSVPFTARDNVSPRWVVADGPDPISATSPGFERMMTLNQWYEAYEGAFGELWGAARSRTVTIMSMAEELGRLLERHPAELWPVLRLALADALGRQPRRSRAHFQRVLLEGAGFGP